MKRKLLITAAILLTGVLSHAQDLDIKPSQQAQGLLESKNAMVDHATGLFHYNVPLYEIKSGDFTLPISLNYIAKGVKVNDQPGLVGYNWTLNSGGVVTRTIRGGIADEDWNGLARRTLSLNPNSAEIEAVNKREKDGETDIFTASFNGQNVKFRIIEDVENRLFKVDPLEKTNNKIICNFQNGIIEEWIITDDSGNKYTFSQKEWASQIYKEEIAGSSGVNNKNYILSWYLNKIEPINGNAIIFSYIENALGLGVQDSIRIIKNYNQTAVVYHYGKNIVNFASDYDKYRMELERCLREAGSYINTANLKIQMDGYINRIIDGKIMQDPFSVTSAISTNRKVFGILSDFSMMTSASIELIDTLNEIIDYYKDQASLDIAIALSYIEEAKRIMFLCITETIETDKEEGFIHDAFQVRSPLLSKIECKDKIISFSYKKSSNIPSEYNSSTYKLNEINLLDMNKKRIKGIRLYNDENFNQISYLDNKGIEYDKITFNYFSKQNGGIVEDLWGYCKNISSSSNLFLFNDAVDIDNVKYRTLSKIITSGGGEMILEYESNIIKKWVAGEIAPFGGIRICKISIKDSNNGNNDVINYRYPTGGISVYGDYSNSVIIKYNGWSFSDKITYNNIIYEGNNFIELGNNSLFYPRVEEELVGNGKNIYSFYVPNIMNFQDKFPYLLYGLPRSKEVYDKNNNLKSRTNFHYHTDETISGLTNNNPERPDICAFNKNIFQIKAYPYYVDGVEMEKKYRDQPLIPAGDNEFINPYTIYLTNVRPRINPTLPANQAYGISYGGCVLLKEKTEYLYDNPNTYLKTEYFYDNFENSIFPTRIITTKSNGNQEIVINKRVTEMSNSVGSIIAEMKSRNMCNPIIKTQKLIRKNNATTYQLIDEKVYDYSNNGRQPQLMKISSCHPATTVNVSIQKPMIDNTLYTQSNYTIEKAFKYNTYLPIYITDLCENQFVKYDLSSDAIILTSRNIEESSIQAGDKSHRSILASETSYLSMRQFICDFYSKFSDVRSFPPEFKNYLLGNECRQFITAIENIYFDENILSFNEFKSATSIAVHNFINLYLANIENIFPNYYLRPTELQQFVDIIDEIVADATGYKYQYVTSLYKNDPAYNTSGFIINNVCKNKYKIYLLNKSTKNVQIDYNITHSAGKYSGSKSYSGSNNWKLSILDIDLSGFSNISFLNVPIPDDNNITYMCIVPTDTEFEATSYNADGTVFCKFNQNGQLERYEYDAAGRVKKIFDNDNNVLKEFNYNVVL